MYTIVLSIFMTVFTGPFNLSMAVFPVPVAIYAGLRRTDLAVGLILCAFVSAFAGVMALGFPGQLISAVGVGSKAALCDGIAAAMGLLIGLGISRCWSHARIVTLASACVYVIAFGIMVMVWKDQVTILGIELESLAAHMEKAGSESSYTNARLLLWLKEHLTELFFGVLFASIYLTVCAVVAIVTWCLRKILKEEGPCDTFGEMRPTEWLVWILIVAAVIGFIDYKFHVPALRIISWNTCCGLSAIYWVNGLSLLFYGIEVSNKHTLVCIGAFMILVFTSQLLTFIGLFDTWSNFRRRIDTIVIDRKLHKESDDE